MSAYVVMDVEIFDIEQYMQFMQRVRPLIEQWGGRYLARGGEFRVYEGDYEPRRLVLLEFPSMDEWDRFYLSDAFQTLKPLRDQCSHSRLIAVTGC
jgi:uncharacterized protein (DUF1330 family)